MTFPSAAVRAETPRGWEEPESGPGAPTWVVDHAAERLSVVLNQPAPMPNGRRKTD